MSLMRWYADNSYLPGIWGAPIEDMLIIGGISVDKDAERSISRIIEDVKSNYRTEADFPIKWNLKDLKNNYWKHGQEELYRLLLRESKQWRRRIFRETKDIDFTIIVAVIKAHSWRRRILLETRQKLTRYVFSDALMRLGYHAKERDPDCVEIILDWPDKKQPRSIFDEEYKTARLLGKTCENRDYHCGSLKELRFSESVLFTSMKECPLLQFSDLVVGAVGDFLDIALEKKQEAFGFEMLKELNMKIRGAPDRVIGRGLIIAPTTGGLIDRVRQFIPKLYE